MRRLTKFTTLSPKSHPELPSSQRIGRERRAAHLRRDPRASIVVCEHSPPCRRVEVRCSAEFLTAGADDAARRIASRYLGRDAGLHTPTAPSMTSSSAVEPGVLRAWEVADQLSLR